MKFTYISMLTLVLALAAASSNAAGPNPKDPPPDRTAGPIEKELTDEAIQALGITAEDLVIVVSHTGQNVLYAAKDKKYAPGSSKKLKGRSYVDGFHVLFTHGSPGCYTYQDVWGNIRWYPSPPCP